MGFVYCFIIITKQKKELHTMKYLLYTCNIIFLAGLFFFTAMIIMGGTGLMPFLIVNVIGLVAITTLLLMGVE